MTKFGEMLSSSETRPAPPPSGEGTGLLVSHAGAKREHDVISDIIPPVTSCHCVQADRSCPSGFWCSCAVTLLAVNFTLCI